MNKRIASNTFPALFIPLSLGFSAIPARTHIQLLTAVIHDRQVTISHTSAVALTLHTTTVSTVLRKSLLVTTLPTQPFLISSGGMVDPERVNCNSISSNAMVEAPEEYRTLSAYCQARSDNSQQPAPKSDTAQPPWQSPYWSNGNICRERGTDKVCLSPQAATKLRWPIP